MSDVIPVTIVIGVTACGKSAVAMELARARGAEILSIDSMQVYRRMDIGTAKATLAEQAQVRHHLIDVVEPGETFSAARYAAMADAAIADMHGRGVDVLGVGGTSLYIKALVEGLFEGPPADPMLRAELHQRVLAEGGEKLHAELARIDPEAAGRIHPNDTRRLVRAIEVHRATGQPISELQRQFGKTRTGFRFSFIGLRREQAEESKRINARVAAMIRDGLVEETRRLLNEPAGLSKQARQALGYAQVIEFIEGRSSLTKTVEQIKVMTRRFAKHQRTWFRRFPDVKWFDIPPDEPPGRTAARILSQGDHM